jgi:hypothetical protein
VAELERLLLAYWRQRLELDRAGPGQAMTALRGHAEAGALLRQLDSWLHQPRPSARVDVEALLAPYQGIAEPVSAKDVGQPA